MSKPLKLTMIAARVMDALTKRLYWKNRQTVKYMSWVVTALEVLSAYALITWALNDLTALQQLSRMEQSEPVMFALLILFKGILAVVPWGVGAIISVVASFLTVELRCANCKDPLSSHETNKGEVHACKSRRFSLRLFRLVKCNCPAFVPPE